MALAGGQLFLTVVYSAIAVWLLGLAVPVTASYIIAAVMVAPALMQSGVPDFAAHMFIFYYAVLSEVSPPTALSPFAAAALTGASPFETMMLTWKYTLPAFLVPFVFTLSPEGAGALLRGPLGTIAVTCADRGRWRRGPRGGSRRVGSRPGVASRAGRSLDSGGLLSLLRRALGGRSGPRPYGCGAVLALLAGSKTRCNGPAGQGALSHQLRDGPKSRTGDEPYQLTLFAS